MEPCPFCAMFREENKVLPDWGVLPKDWESHRYGVFYASFTPLNPVTSGHLLFVPRHHIEDAADNPDEAAFITKQAYLRGARRGEDFNVITSKGKSATQSVFHLHVHYVPRRPGDGLSLPWTGQDR